jgi:hypothetical protein
MIKLKFIGTALSLFLSVTAIPGQQVADSTYWFYFTDKNNNEFSLSNPDAFLSQRSLERRAWQSLPVDMTDLPITGMYLDSLESLGLHIVHTSKWLNGALVESTDRSLIDTLHQLSFVDTLPWIPDRSVKRHLLPPVGERFEPPSSTAGSFDYGISLRQVEQLGIPYLHQDGYTGKGVYVTVLDGGFIGMDASLPAFDRLISEGRLLATRNLVRNLSGVYDGITHGMGVASTIVGNWNGMLIGTGPDASLIIATTENPESETKIEEFAWIEASEWADSLGTDIINTSLGYSRFDDSLTNYTYEDLDGKTSFISRANSMVAGKGMVSVTSAGNSGDNKWFYITPPADALDMIAVGAIDSMEVITGFSSRGPTYDYRIKPEVVAMGRSTVIQGVDGSVRLANGTSFASPLIAGAVASLWQAHPEVPAKELIRAILYSADRRYNPDATYGYGVPNFLSALHSISSVIGSISGEGPRIYPNPFQQSIHIDLSPELADFYVVTLYDLQGRMIIRKEMMIPGETELPESLRPGIYLLELSNGNTRYRARIVK